MTAATKPQEIPVAAPSTAARRDGDAPGRLPEPTATAASTTPGRDQAGQQPRGAGACSRPPDGDARPRNTPIPTDMAAAASQSRRRTFTRPAPATARYPKTNSISSARMGWTRASAPYRSALS